MAIDEAFVVQTDQELIERSVPLHARPFHVVLAWMRTNNLSGNILVPELWEPLMVAYKRLYPSGDFSIPAMLVGGVALRDRFYLARVDVSYGVNRVEPLRCIDIAPAELEVIWQQHPRQIWRALYSVADLWDFAYGVSDLRDQNGRADELWHNARSAISSTARTLGGAIDLDTAVQSSCLAAELALKGTLAYLGWPENRYRPLGHKLSELAAAVISERSTTEDDRLRKICAAFPDYVRTRYEPHGLGRVGLMLLAMRGQFVAADALRRVSGRDLAKQIETGAGAMPREDL